MDGDGVYFFSDRARLRARVNKITFAQKNLNMIRCDCHIGGRGILD